MTMKKKIFLLLFCVLIVFFVSVGMAGAKTWHVDDDFVEYPAADFSSIQDAIDSSDPGDIVYVYKGTYYENVIIDKPLELTGEGKKTIIHGGWYGNCVKIMSSNVSIDGFTIKYSGSDDAGIYVSSNNNTIANNTLIENGYGIKLIEDNNTIMNNVITNNSDSDGTGIYVSSNSNTIANNTFWNMDLRYSRYNNIINNSVNKEINITDSDYNLISNNYVNGSINLEDSQYNNITDNSAKGIDLDSDSDSQGSCRSYNNTIANNTVKYIILEGCDSNKIINNLISQSNEDGININCGYYRYQYSLGGGMVQLDI
jgi:parallel beta-helix repeat protein